MLQFTEEVGLGGHGRHLPPHLGDLGELGRRLRGGAGHGHHPGAPHAVHDRQLRHGGLGPATGAPC